jgi:hypothetical protein
LVDFNGDGNFDEIDAAILEEEKNEKKQPAKNSGSGCCVILFAACATISLAAWSINHYMI